MSEVGAGIGERDVMTSALPDVDLGPYTARARAAMGSAQLNARALDHEEIAPGHLLLGLVAGPGQGIASVILSTLAVAPEAIKRDVEEGMGVGSRSIGEHLPLSDATREVLNLALRESPGTGPNRIGTDHLLIGLLRQGGFATQVLNRHGVVIERITATRQQLRSVICYGCAEYSHEPGPSAGPELLLPPEVHHLDAQLVEIRRLKEEGHQRSGLCTRGRDPRRREGSAPSQTGLFGGGERRVRPVCGDRRDRPPARTR